MSYYFSKTIDLPFDKATDKVIEALKEEGYGILTEIDVKATLKKKLDVDFRNYKILGACNPQFAHKALLSEDKLGVLLPCNFVVEEHETGEIEVSAVDPLVSMSGVGNESLAELATEVKDKLNKVIESLNA